MAIWDRKFSNGSFAGNWNGRLVYDLNSQNTGANTSNITLTLQTFSDGSSYSQNGLWDGRIYVNGGQVERQTPTKTISNSPSTLCGWNGNIGHDANGNAFINIGDYINAPVNEMTFAEIGWSLPRIPLAPSILGNSADQIKPTTVRLGSEINNVGHGTSANVYMQYRLQGTSTFTNTALQADVGGYNYWTVTGLKPGKVYEYRSVWANNNGDTTISGLSTFKTKGVPGMIPVLLALT